MRTRLPFAEPENPEPAPFLRASLAISEGQDVAADDAEPSNQLECDLRMVPAALVLKPSWVMRLTRFLTISSNITHLRSAAYQWSPPSLPVDLCLPFSLLQSPLRFQHLGSKSDDFSSTLPL